MFYITFASTIDLYLAVTASILSLIGSLIIIVLNVRFPDYRKNFFRKLIFILSIYDAILSFLFLIPGNKNQGFCAFQGYAIVWLGSMPAYISLSISIITYLNVSKNWSVFRLKKISNKLHIVSAIVATILTCFTIGFAESVHFPFTNWCFIKGRFMLGAFYFLIWICTIASIVLYIMIVKQIRFVYKTIEQMTNLVDKRRKRDNLKVQMRMSTIPLSLVLTWLIASIRRSREIFFPDSNQNSTLNVLHSLTNPLQGFFDCVVFVAFSSYSRQKLKELVCCKEPQDSQDFTHTTSFDEEERRM
ncbi:g protein-coupled receptor [Anaeramoeba flamelloides]|uniref:G protein-coupled receptor n=1 Tax=Anaeramoeba flamelloides TaxID=1746091 RepID=A0AAV7YGC7_9EUKA|nr:g protein-coupled receptor [Anaeramoeba flamelloides]